MGAMEFQIFVSLLVVLGAAFVALVCDFLKGNNEQLREANIELRVRQEERERAIPRQEPSQRNRRDALQDSVQTEIDRRKSAAASEALQPPWLVPVRPEPETPQQASGPPPGSRASRGRAAARSRQRTAEIEQWARQVVERKPPAPVSPPQAASAFQARPAPEQPAGQPAPETREPAPSETLLPLPAGTALPQPRKMVAPAPELEWPTAPALKPSTGFSLKLLLLHRAKPVAAVCEPVSPGTEALSFGAVDGSEAAQPQTSRITPTDRVPGEAGILGLESPSAVAPSGSLIGVPVSSLASVPSPSEPPAPAAHGDLTPSPGMEAGLTALPESAPMTSGPVTRVPPVEPQDLVAPRTLPRLRGGLEGMLDIEEVFRPQEETPEEEPDSDDRVVRIRVLEDADLIAKDEFQAVPPPSQGPEVASEAVASAPAPPAASSQVPTTAGFLPQSEGNAPPAQLLAADSPLVYDAIKPRPPRPTPPTPAWTAAVTPAGRSKVIEMRITPSPSFNIGLETPADEFRPAFIDVPTGYADAVAFQKLLAQDGLFRGLTIVIGVLEYEALVAAHGVAQVEAALNKTERIFQALAQDGGFGCRSAAGEYILLFPGLVEAAAQRRVNALSERLWDHQLRSLGLLPVLLSWGSAESPADALPSLLSRAREQMIESRRVRRTAMTASGRFRRRAVNA